MMNGHHFNSIRFTLVKFLFLVLMFFFFSCNPTGKKTIEKQIVELNKYIYVPVGIDWQILNFFDWEEPGYLIESVNWDTTYRICYSILENDRYYILSLTKTYFSDDYYYEIEFSYTLDTSYFYRSRTDDFKVMEFFIGKYSYQANHKLLSEGQYKFFEQNRDSLKKIRGDSLPPLPDVFE